jgi:hypothetical protein
VSELEAARERLARQQATLTAYLVAGAEKPDGFNEKLVTVARSALLNKRAGEVAHAWPALRNALGDQWRNLFRDWAAGKPPRGSFRDGFDFARHLAATGRLPAGAVDELIAREGHWHYPGGQPPRHRPGWLPILAQRWLGTLRVYRLTRPRSHEPRSHEPRSHEPRSHEPPRTS